MTPNITRMAIDARAVCVAVLSRDQCVLEAVSCAYVR